MRFDVLTIFPAMIEAAFSEGVVARAIRAGTLELRVHDLREHAEGRHRKVDDEPFGGGAGMVLKPEPIFLAVESIRAEAPGLPTRTVLLSPQGERFDQRVAERFAASARSPRGGRTEGPRGPSCLATPRDACR